MRKYVVMVIITITSVLTVFIGFSVGEDKPVADTNKKAPKMEHDAPLVGELCVTCHMEQKENTKSISPKINNKHEVCNKCHLADGTITGHCGCGDVSNPMDCAQCHATPAMGTNPSAEDMNRLCLKCH